MRSLIKDLKDEIETLQLEIDSTDENNNCNIEVSDKVFNTKGDGKIIEKILKRVNCAVNNFIKNEGHYVLKHPNIWASEIELYRFDGTHLSDIGNDIYLNNLQGALETFITSPNTKSFPVVNI